MKVSRRDHSNQGATGLLMPATVFLGLVFIVPLIRLITVSVTGSVEPFGNYTRAITSGAYTQSIINTFQIAVVVTAFTLLIGYPVAYLMTSARPRVRWFVAIMIVVPYFIAVLIRSYGWIIMLGTRGPINNSLLALGVVDEPLRLIFTRFAVIVAMTFVLLPMMVLPLFSVMKGINPALIRAAESLGASPAAAFFRIYLPLSKSGILAGSLIVFILSLGFFITPTLVGGPGDRVISMDIAAQAGQITSAGFIEAIAVMLLLVTLAILGIASRFAHLGDIWRVSGAPQHRKPRSRSRRREHLGNSSAIESILQLLGRLPAAVGVAYSWCVTGVALVAVAGSLVTIVVLSFSSSTFLTFPPPGYSTRWYADFFSSARWLNAFATSVGVATVTAGFTAVLGLLTAIGLVRSNSRLKGVVMGLIMGPMIVPAVVIALSLYWFFLWTGVRGSIFSLVLSHSLGALPLVAIIVAANVQSVDRNLELAAASLGAPPFTVIARIVVPLIAPGVAVGALFAFLHSFDELTMTLFVRGIGTKTLPIELWADLNFNLTPILAVVSTINIALVLLGLLIAVGIRKATRLLSLPI